MKINHFSYTDISEVDKLSIKLDGKSAVIFEPSRKGRTPVLKAMSYLFHFLIKTMNPNWGGEIKSEGYIGSNSPNKLEGDFEYIDGKEFNFEFDTSLDEYDDVGRVVDRERNIELKEIKENISKMWQKDKNPPVLCYYPGIRGFYPTIFDNFLKVSLNCNIDYISKDGLKSLAYEDTLSLRSNWKNFYKFFGFLSVSARNDEYIQGILDTIKSGVQIIDPEIEDFYLNGEGEFYITRNKVTYSESKFSNSEFNLIFLVCDLMMRLYFANPKMKNSFEGTGIVLIENIENNLNLNEQIGLLDKLKKLFPNIQFIITTNSPFILADTPTDFKIFSICETENDSGEGCNLTVVQYENEFKEDAKVWLKILEKI